MYRQLDRYNIVRAIPDYILSYNYIYFRKYSKNMSHHKVLFVLSSHDQLGSTGKQTGWYLPEFAHPYYVLAPHVEVVVASPSGGAAPLDPSSVEMFKDDEECQKFLKENQSLWKNTKKLSTFVGQANEFDAVLFVGGHGRKCSCCGISNLDIQLTGAAMFDLATDENSRNVASLFAHGTF